MLTQDRATTTARSLSHTRGVDEVVDDGRAWIAVVRDWSMVDGPAGNRGQQQEDQHADRQQYAIVGRLAYRRTGFGGIHHRNSDASGIAADVLRPLRGGPARRLTRRHRAPSLGAGVRLAAGSSVARASSRDDPAAGPRRR